MDMLVPIAICLGCVKSSNYAVIVIEDIACFDKDRGLLAIMKSSKVAATRMIDEAPNTRARAHLSPFLQFVNSLSPAEEEEEEEEDEFSW